MKKNNRPADFIYRKNIDEMTLLFMRGHLFLCFAGVDSQAVVNLFWILAKKVMKKFGGYG